MGRITLDSVFEMSWKWRQFSDAKGVQPQLTPLPAGAAESRCGKRHHVKNSYFLAPFWILSCKLEFMCNWYLLTGNIKIYWWTSRDFLYLCQNIAVLQVSAFIYIVKCFVFFPLERNLHRMSNVSTEYYFIEFWNEATVLWGHTVCEASYFRLMLLSVVSMYAVVTLQCSSWASVCQIWRLCTLSWVFYNKMYLL